MERLTKRKEENGQRWIELRCCADCSECCDCEDIWMALDRLAAYEDTGLTPEEIKTLQELHDFYNSKDCLASRRLVELALADKDGRCVVLPKLEESEYNGLKVKYRVYKARNGEAVENCFVLRPDKDRAAMPALREYAKATPNSELRADIQIWLDCIERGLDKCMRSNCGECREYGSPSCPYVNDTREEAEAEAALAKKEQGDEH